MKWFVLELARPASVHLSHNKIVLLVGDSSTVLSYCGIPVVKMHGPYKDKVTAENNIHTNNEYKISLSADTGDKICKSSQPKSIVHERHVCPHCQRQFDKRFALTNHINWQHKDK